MLLALYHAGCIVEKAKHSDFEHKGVCTAIMAVLFILGILTFATAGIIFVVGTINQVYVANTTFYQWIWIVIYVFDLICVTVISFAFFGIATSNDHKQKQGLLLLVALVTSFIVLAALVFATNIADTIVMYIEKDMTNLAIKDFIVFVVNHALIFLMLLANMIIFLPWVNRAESLSDLS